MIARWLWPHRMVADFLPAEALTQLREAVLDSPYLAATDLNEGFAGTSGFTLLFQLEERERAERLLPELTPFLTKVIQPKANVFFLNPLVIHAGGNGVAPHADKTLVSYLDSGDPPFPFCVSVLYLSLPEAKTGGHLVFHRAVGKLARQPRENMLIEFPGWMLHEVTPLTSAEGSPPRISLVLEQYSIAPAMRAEIPSWSLETTRPFSEFLEQAEAEPDFEAESDLEQESDFEAEPDLEARPDREAERQDEELGREVLSEQVEGGGVDG